MADDSPSTETVGDITARIGQASEAELAELEADDRKGVQQAVAAERQRRASGTETPEQAEATRRAQANTGRPPAEEVSRQALLRYHGTTDLDEIPVDNGDPELLAAGNDPAELARIRTERGDS